MSGDPISERAGQSEEPSDPPKKPSEPGNQDRDGVDADAPLWKWLGRPRPRQGDAIRNSEPSQPPRPRSLAEAIAMDSKAHPETKPAIRIKVVVGCAIALISVPVAGFLISHAMRMNAEHDRGAKLLSTDKATQDFMEETRQNKVDQDELVMATRAFANGNISLNELHRIERRIEARAAARHDLKQTQDDFDAGHISIGELHRIQREVRDRLEWANAP